MNADRESVLGEVMNGAQAILRMLELHGVTHVFGLPGETTIGWYKEWQSCSDIEYVLTRDERTASYAAEAYAKITGRPAVLEAPSPMSLLVIGGSQGARILSDVVPPAIERLPMSTARLSGRSR